MPQSGNPEISKNLQPLSDPNKIAAVMKAIGEYDLVGSIAWSDLDALSTSTEFEEMEVVPEGVFASNDGFTALATVYVVLRYGGDNEDGFESLDSYPARVVGHFDSERDELTAIVDAVQVDTSSFYE